MRECLHAPTPAGRTDVRELQLLAIDLETTGLDPRADHIVSAGFVPVDGLRIRLGGADHLLRRLEVGVGQSATIHRLTDDALAGGVELRELVERVAVALTGRLLLAHHAGLETAFLSAACERTHGVPLPVASVDTMELQRRVLRSTDDATLPQGALRLPTARAHLGLPRYAAHDALADALGCAELYLAQVARLSGGRSMTLRAVQR